MRALFILLCFIVPFISCASCTNNADSLTKNNILILSVTNMKIKVSGNTFRATLYDNATATAFKDMLPLTLNMLELNDNEKYAELPKGFKINAFNPGTIQNGDLMLYGSSTLVLFYKTFSTSYSYTKLGKVDDVTGLAKALGSGNVSVTFEVE